MLIFSRARSIPLSVEISDISYRNFDIYVISPGMIKLHQKRHSFGFPYREIGVIALT